jgi:serine/threonine protein kinase/Tol biopolymer transport system component
MGAVYLAHDTRLNRDVAVKVLPDAFAHDADRLARFTREAQSLAALNHPHIAHVYGLEDLQGTTALVMEYVPGRTLEATLANGRPLPYQDVLSIGRQLAEGLEAAHEKSIVHRDLKPANVILADDGNVKILDFGLAKAFDASSQVDLMNSPTMMSPAMTMQGVILGTAAYMSPEQARGRQVDKRSDVWAFGVVLWEMLTGRRPFNGETVTDTLAAIIGTEPPWSELPADTPAALRGVLRRALEKDPHQRLRDIGEARIAFQTALTSHTNVAAEQTPSSTASEVPPRRDSRARSVLPWGLAALGLLLAFVTPLLKSRQSADPPLMNFDVSLPAGSELRLLERPAVAISDDGQTVAFAAFTSDDAQLYVRRRDEAAAHALPVHFNDRRAGGRDIAFSPDGKYVAFTNGDALVKVPLDGGPAVRLAPVLSGTRGLTWVGNDRIVYSPAPRTGLLIVDANGGDPRELTKVSLENNERSHRWPTALPGGKTILFTVGALESPDSYDDANIDALVLATGERKRVLTGASFARYAPGGKLIFSRGPSLYAIDFDPDRLTTSGIPVLVVPRVATDPNTGATHFAVAQDGTIIYVNGPPTSGLRRLVWVDRSGAMQPIDLTPDVFNDPAISPDGTRAALLVGPIGHGDIWIYDFRQTTFSRLTTDGKGATPVWSSDGQSIYYVSIDTTRRETLVMRRRADGSGEPERLASTKLRAYLGGVLGDGSAAIGAANEWSGSFNIVRIPLGPGQPLVTVTNSQTQAYGATVSPDGKWFAYSSEESGRREVYVREVAGDAHWLVSVGGGEEAHWAPDGSALYYRIDDRLMMVPVRSGSAFSAGKPSLLLRGVYNLQSETGSSYAVDPKSGRFLMIRLASDQSIAADSFRIVLNWAQHLGAARQ